MHVLGLSDDHHDSAAALFDDGRIVATLRRFMGTEIDELALGRCYLRKEGQKIGATNEHRAAFALD